MTRLQHLTALRDKVKAETAKFADFEAVFPDRTEHWDEDPLAHSSAAYLGSVDAAKELHDSLLPGWRFGIRSHDEIEGAGFFAWVHSPDFEVSIIVCGGEEKCISEGIRGRADAELAGRALLLADLNALIAQEGGE